MTTLALHELPEHARRAWLALRDELRGILGNDLVAIWAHGGTTSVADPPRQADLDTLVILARSPDAATARRIEAAQDAIASQMGVEWDVSYVLAADAGGAEPPRHPWRADEMETRWAIHRGQWLAGRYLNLHGPDPAQVVVAPTREELDHALRGELEHLERHVSAGDTGPFETTYALLNGSRILHALETGNVAISKHAAGTWALEHLPDRWHPVLHAALRSYHGHASSADVDLLAADMAPFVAFVRERLPA